IASRSLESCQQAATEISEATGAEVLAKACHVGRWEDVTRLMEKIDEELGGLDVLVNNAGMAPLYDSFEGISEELFDKTIGVNLKGPFRLSALAGARMTEA